MSNVGFLPLALLALACGHTQDGPSAEPEPAVPVSLVEAPLAQAEAGSEPSPASEAATVSLPSPGGEVPVPLDEAAPPAEDVEPPQPEAEARPCGAPGPGCTCIEEPEGQVCFEAYAYAIEPLSPELREEMTGVSWREGCPIHLDDLRHLTMSHWTFDGERQQGELIVSATVAEAVAGVFHAIHDARFPIARMERVSRYDASDAKSMAANNTSAFNCRFVGGTKTWSQHAYGTAIDINPIQNPWVKGTRVDPSEGAPYIDRTMPQPGMVVEGDAVVRAFDSAGWYWGGRWNSVKDYQHFSENGR